MIRTIIFAFVIAVATTASAFATEINFAATIDNPEGKPFQECLEVDTKANPPTCKQVGDLTLRLVATSSLNVPEQNMTVENIVARGNLAVKIGKAIGPVDLTVDEISLLKTQIAKSNLLPLERYGAIRLLDPASVKAK